MSNTTMQKQHGHARVTQITRSAPDTVHMVLETDWFQNAQPGQFVMIRIQADTEPLLRRPISLCFAKPGTVELLFKIRGIGTERMAAWPVGHSVDIIGPLGNGFTLPRHQTTAFLVAGGIGIAPLIFLARSIRNECPGCDLHLFLGAQTSKDIDAFTPFIPDDTPVQIATEDGTYGKQGLVTDILTDDADIKKPLIFYGCGPTPMLQSLAELARTTANECQVSLESHMACGIGACLGCTVATHGSNTTAPLRVCADGPVFDANRIFPAH